MLARFGGILWRRQAAARGEGRGRVEAAKGLKQWWWRRRGMIVRLRCAGLSVKLVVTRECTGGAVAKLLLLVLFVFLWECACNAKCKQAFRLQSRNDFQKQ